MIDREVAIARLMTFLNVEGITGQEAAIAQAIQADLRSLGVPSKAIRFDDANARIELPTQTGNLIVKIPGSKGFTTHKPILFSTHLDTVPLCAGAKPTRKGSRIVSDGKTALGGDNRTGCAVLVTLIETLSRHQLNHPPLTLLFTVREESGLFGARHLDKADLGPVAYGFNVDGRRAADLTIGAVGAERWEVMVQGQAAHAGVHPHKGISAQLIHALALSQVYAEGWFGKVVKGRGDDRQGTSNVGIVGNGKGGGAGDATNVVTDFLHVRGESRSHDAKFVKEITAAYKKAYQEAAAKVQDDAGNCGKVKFVPRLDYYPFELKENSPVIRHAVHAVKTLGLEPTLKVTSGGLDANWLVKHGIPSVTFGAGQNEIHTVKEWVDLDEFIQGCELAVTLATISAAGT